MAKRIADQVDAAELASVSQNPKGTLMQCDSKTWRWAGFTTIELKDTAKAQAILGQMQSYWSAQKGFTATPGKSNCFTLPDDVFPGGQF